MNDAEEVLNSIAAAKAACNSLSKPDERLTPILTSFETLSSALTQRMFHIEEPTPNQSMNPNLTSTATNI